MGAADVVPGVSGGTIAFLTGIYEPLMRSISSLDKEAFSLLLRGRISAFFRRVEWAFLLTLLTGAVFAIALLASLVHGFLQHEIYRSYLYSLFFGLILSSIFYCLKQVRLNYIALALGACLAIFFTNLSPKVSETLIALPISENLVEAKNYDAQKGLLKVSPAELRALLAKAYLLDSQEIEHEGELVPLKNLAAKENKSFFDSWIFFCGLLGVSAMLLPGISGSYILNVLGVYPLVIAAIADFVSALRSFSIDTYSFTLLANLALGIIVGAALFSRLIAFLFRRYRSFSLSCLIGFMLGSLAAVWPFWETAAYYNPVKLEKGLFLEPVQAVLPTASLLFPSLIFFFLGFTFTFLLEYLTVKEKAC